MKIFNEYKLTLILYKKFRNILYVFYSNLYLEYINGSINIGKTYNTSVVIIVIDAIVELTDLGETWNMYKIK